jgi:hypothetical protein
VSRIRLQQLDIPLLNGTEDRFLLVFRIQHANSLLANADAVVGAVILYKHRIRSHVEGYIWSNFLLITPGLLLQIAEEG